MFRTALLSLIFILGTHTSAEAAKNPKVELTTNKGKIVIELDETKAPKTVANFVGYVEKGFYNNTAFHRVINNFMIQGGGFEVKEGKLEQKKPGNAVKNEAKNGLKNKRGTIAMARTSDPHSATSQFFINVVDNDRLNYTSDINMGYTVFGKVTQGMEVVDKIKATPTSRKPVKALSGSGSHVETTFSDVPKDNIVITAAKILK